MKLLVILGATGSGKSSLALQMAEILNAPIVCVDSTTVYRELNIGTAKPTEAERAQVPHHMLDRVSISEEFSFARFKREVEEILAGYQAAGRQWSILVGGTHLYLRGIVDGYQLSEVGPQPQFREWAEQQPLENLVLQLQELDPDSLGIVDLKNPRRVIRALEVCRYGPALFSQGYRRQPIAYPVFKIGLKTPEDWLHSRLASRLDQMLANGWQAEVQEILRRGGEQHLRRLRVIGYLDLVDFCAQQISLAGLKEKVLRDTLQLVRKQRVWYRKEEGVHWIAADSNGLVEEVTALLSSLAGP